MPHTHSLALHYAYVQHGLTEMNVYLEKVPYNSRGFKDPGL